MQLFDSAADFEKFTYTLNLHADKGLTLILIT